MKVSFNITKRTDDPHDGRACCAICNEWFPLDTILGHVRGAHDLDVEVATWPDGSPVIVDETLAPDDFTQAGPGESDG